MKNVVVTVLGAFVLAIAMATAAFGAQTADSGAAVRSVSDPLSTAMRLQAETGQVVGVLPSTSTGGGTDAVVLVILGIGAAAGGAVLIRKAVTES